MTTFTNRRGATRSDIAGRFAAMLKVGETRMTQYRTYRRTLAELNGLTDRELADLGIHRAMISTIASEAAYGAA